MPKDCLGLFDTPPSRSETRLGLMVVALLFVSALIVLPFRDVWWGEIVAFVPAINAAMFVAELIIATLLYAQAVIFRSRALTLLASSYVFIAALLVPHALTFPGAFAEDGLLGAGVSSTGWIGSVRRLAFPIAVGTYAWLKQADIAAGPREKRPRIVASAMVAIGAAASVTLLATAGSDLLPSFFANRAELVRGNFILLSWTVVLLTVGAMLVLLRRPRSVLDGWLLVALVAWLFQSLLNMQLQARFTVGFYSLFLMMMAATVILLLALVAESSRLYVRLALSESAHNREREARLMSMSAIAAASFQEVGQPLSAALSSAAASKAWLTQVPPDRKKAIESLDDTIEAGRQTFEIMKNVRARFTGELGGGEEFCLNELVREAALLMDRELTARKVSLQLDLDEPLPRVLGDQTQMRRVLLHLMAELFEPRNDARRQPTRILVRTAASNARYLILDVGDHHTAHIDEEMDQVFGPFCEASENGTGVSLALCRTIIEDHGGYLFVLRIPEHGPRFRLKLPFREPTGQAFA